MSLEELEAIECVNEYLLKQSLEAMDKALRGETSFADFHFWAKSSNNYVDYYLSVKKQV